MLFVSKYFHRRCVLSSTFTCYLNLLLSKTWLTESEKPTQILNNYNFHSSHRSGGRVGGGVGIFTHESLSAKTAHHHSTKQYSTVWVNIQHKGKSTIYGCIYHPKSRASTDTDEILRHISETMVKLRLCGFGVALSAEAEAGQFRTDRACQSGHKHVENIVPDGAQTHNLKIEGLMLFQLSHGCRCVRRK